MSSKVAFESIVKNCSAHEWMGNYVIFAVSESMAACGAACGNFGLRPRDENFLSSVSLLLTEHPHQLATIHDNKRLWRAARSQT